jgi:hypothetical protein
MTHRHEANYVCFVADGIDDSKPADPKLPQSVELAQQASHRIPDLRRWCGLRA